MTESNSNVVGLDTLVKYDLNEMESKLYAASWMMPKDGRFYRVSVTFLGDVEGLPATERDDDDVTWELVIREAPDKETAEMLFFDGPTTAVIQFGNKTTTAAQAQSVGFNVMVNVLNGNLPFPDLTDEVAQAMWMDCVGALNAAAAAYLGASS